MNDKKDDKTEVKTQSEQMWRRKIIQIISTAVVLLGICYFIPDMGLPFVLGAVLMAVIIYAQYRFFPGSYKNTIPKEEYSFIEQEVLTNIKIPPNMPLPYAIFDDNHVILIYNELFKTLFQKYSLNRISIQKLFPQFELTKEKQFLEADGLFLEAYTQKYHLKDKKKGRNNDIYSLCLVDVTEFQQLKKTVDLQKTVVALVFIDNYEEVLETLEESSLPLLTALIDRKLNSLAAETKGVMKKVEKDRYLFITSLEKLEELKEKKFEILNEIREINIGEHIPVTLSIGIGIGWDSLESAMKDARAAIDLALGRGGDQVLIKDGEKYLFYGGKSGEVGHNARIRARVKADALWELIGEAGNVFVMGHKQGDLDSFGSAIGIYAIVKTMHKPCHIVMDTISDGVKQMVERLKEAGGYETLLVTNKEAMDMVNDKSLIVVTDTHRRSRVECETLLQATKKIVVFDHHRKSTDFIDTSVLMYHEPYASSTAELVTEMIQYFGEKIKLKPIEADALLAGITLDTKNFCVKTGAITFEAAAYLKRSGADSIRVRLLFQNDMDAYKAKAAAVREAEIFMDSIALSICPVNSVNTSLTAAQAADDLLNVAGIKASIVLCQMEDTIYVSARSFGDINVQLIMEKVGGGGHLSVSGAQMTGMTIQEAYEKIKNAIKEYIQEEN